MKLTEIVKKPIITEKTLRLAREDNVYTFGVDRRANKNQIKAAIEKIFNVHVVEVRTVVQPAKKKRRGMMRLKTVVVPPVKKAFVKLKAGEKVDLFEIGE